ncbi:hypothetical protein LUZ60_001252 [Juncus effusus]|nr:hypothetical protein LUZ60_001252 [Juncus effusus]
MSANLRRTKPSPATQPQTLRTYPWSVFDAVRSFPPTPESLMSEIDAAIASTEYSRSSSPPPSSKTNSASKEQAEGSYDARIAEEAYKAACSALSAGRPDSAVRSLKVALDSCPPDKPSAIAKLRSLLAIANSQLQKKQQKQPAFP